MPAVPVIAAVGAVAGGVGMVQQARAGRQAASAQRDQAAAQQAQQRIQQRQADRQVAQQRRQAIREARAARGSVLTQGSQAGAMQSSGVMGGLASVTSQQRGRDSFLTQTQSLSSVSSMYGERAAAAGTRMAQAQARSQMWGSVANFGMSAMGGQQMLGHTAQTLGGGGSVSEAFNTFRYGR